MSQTGPKVLTDANSLESLHACYAEYILHATRLFLCLLSYRTKIFEKAIDFYHILIAGTQTHRFVGIAYEN